MIHDPATIEQARRLGVRIPGVAVEPRPRFGKRPARPTRLSDGRPLPTSACLDCGGHAAGRPYCVPCAKVEVEFFAAVWGSLIVTGMILNGGRIPDIDPALLRSPD